MMPKGFTCEDVAQVHFDEGHGYGEQGIAQGDAGVREGSRIDDDEADMIAFRRLYLGDQFVLRVALRRDQLVTQGLCKRGQTGLDVLQRGRSIHARLARAEKVQIRTIEQQNSRQDCCPGLIGVAKVRDNNQNLG